MMKYDVFISYSRKDYVDEHEVVKADSPVKAILEFLDEHQITYWFDKEGIYSGSEFVEVIANAIADSKMMLFISSVHSNESIYTAGEIFEAIENQQLIIPIKIDDSKYNKKFKLLLNPLDYVDYSKSDALDDLFKAIEVEKDRILKLEKEQASWREELSERERRESVKKEVLEQVNELKKLTGTRNALLESIYKKLRSIDVVKKQCPICDSKTDLDTEYCQTCGWYFPTLSGIDNLDIEVDKSALILAKSRWESNVNQDSTISNLQTKNKELGGQITQQKVKINSLSQKLESYKKENESLKGQTNLRFSLKNNIIKYLIGGVVGFIAFFLLLLVIGMKASKTKNEGKKNTINHEQVVTEASIQEQVNSEAYVDLGLSVMWASCNLGATKPQESGGYFAFGELKEKDEYTLETYAYTSSAYGYTQVKSIGSDIKGTEYDVVTSTLGENYRMPTREEVKELILECEWKKHKLDGVEGMLVTGKNGNSIFIPEVGNKEGLRIGGVSYYWTSNQDPSNFHAIFSIGNEDAHLCEMIPYSLEIGYEGADISSTLSYIGCPIRPVKTK